MDARELRVGNIIGLDLKGDKQNFFRVVEPAEFHMKTESCGMNFNSKGNEVYYLDAELFERVPLTRELLTMLGAEQFGQGKKMLLLGGRVISYNTSGRYWFDLKTSKKLKYVHQVQNFIFALEDVELLDLINQDLVTQN